MNRIADLHPSVTITADPGVVQITEQSTQAFIISAIPGEPGEAAPQARTLADWPNFVVVEKGARIVEVQEVVSAIGIHARGMQGPPGPAGPPGSLDGTLDGLNDVLLVNLREGQLLRYSKPLAQWVNSDILDGGNF